MVENKELYEIYDRIAFGSMTIPEFAAWLDEVTSEAHDEGYTQAIYEERG